MHSGLPDSQGCLVSVKVPVDVVPQLETDERLMQQLCTVAWAGLREREGRIKHTGPSNVRDGIPPESGRDSLRELFVEPGKSHSRGPRASRGVGG